MLRRPCHETDRRDADRNQKTTHQTKPGKDRGACAVSRADRKRRRDLPEGGYFSAAHVPVEKPVQRDSGFGIQADQGGSAEPKIDSRDLRNPGFERGADGRERGAHPHVDGTGLAEKKKELGLADDLRGRHLAARERVGLVEMIEATTDHGTSCESACKVLELNSRAVYRWKGEKLGGTHGGGGGQNKITIEEENAQLLTSY